MKKLLILSLLVIFTVPFLSAQSTVEIGKKFVNSKAGDVQSILKNEVSYYQIHVSEKKKTVVSIEVDGAVYVYKLIHSDKKVIINYRHFKKKHLLELEEVKKNRNYTEIHAGTHSTDIVLEY
jgi:competence protein ComGC